MLESLQRTAALVHSAGGPGEKAGARAAHGEFHVLRGTCDDFADPRAIRGTDERHPLRTSALAELPIGVEVRVSLHRNTSSSGLAGAAGPLMPFIGCRRSRCQGLGTTPILTSISTGPAFALASLSAAPRAAGLSTCA